MQAKQAKRPEGLAEGLTRNTQIPTAVRGKVRALVKAHTHWPTFLRMKGIISANATNANLITFALCYPELAAQIEALMGCEASLISGEAGRKCMASTSSASSASAGIDTQAIEELAAEVEALLRKAAKRAADEYKARRQAITQIV